MGDLYLCRVQIANFRTYGSDFDLHIPDKPGLTIISGKNGLGKTAFVEAIEWALTGKVQRLDSRRKRTPLDRILRRHECSSDDPTTVTLEFNDGRQVTRTIGATDSTDDDEIISIIRDTRWRPEIHDIGTYLRLTHFLPQSSQQRFLETPEDAQWRMLKGPAGVERLERFRRLLGDRKANQAFGRRIESLTRQVELSRSEIKAFEDILERRRRLQQQASALDALSPDAMVMEQATLRQRLVDAGVSGVLADSGDVDVEQVRLTEAVDRGLERMRFLRNQVDLAAEILREWRDVNSRQSQSDARLSAATASLDESRKQLAAAREALQMETGRQEQLEKERLEAQQRLDATNQLSSATEALTQIRETLPSLEMEQRKLDEVISELTGKLAEVDRQLQERHVVTAELNTVRQTAAEIQALSRSLKEINASVAELKTLEVAQAESAQEREETESEIRDREKAVDARRKSVDSIREEIQQEQLTVDAMSRAVLEITSLLTEHHTQCPVCTAEYSPEELARRVNQAAKDVSGNAANLNTRLSDAQKQLNVETEALEVVRQRLNEIETVQKEFEQRTTAVEKQQTELLSHPLLAGIPFTNCSAALTQRATELQVRDQELTRRLTEFPPELELKNEASEFQSSLDQRKRARDQLRIEQDEQVEQRRRHEAAIKTYAELAADLLQEGVVPVSALEESQKSVSDREAVAQHHRPVVEAARDAHQQAQQTVSKRAEARQQYLDEQNGLRERRDALAEKWSEYGLTDEPDEARLADHRTRLSESISICEAVKERLHTVAKRSQQWARDEELRNVQIAVDARIKASGASDTESCQTALLQNAKQAEADLRRAETAQTQASGFAEKLQDESERFSRIALTPLNARIQAFNRVISPFPYEFRITPHHTSTRTAAKQSMAVPSADGTSSREFDPATHLSEGQMSALGLSVLLAASMEYRWSRWPALVLDDPMQNNDLIHVAALIDVVRGLMADNGFQIILSTHDAEEASYISRKCLNAGLPVHQCELLGPGPDGVRWRESRSN